MIRLKNCPKPARKVYVCVDPHSYNPHRRDLLKPNGRYWLDPVTTREARVTEVETGKRIPLAWRLNRFVEET